MCMEYKVTTNVDASSSKSKQASKNVNDQVKMLNKLLEIEKNKVKELEKKVTELELKITNIRYDYQYDVTDLKKTIDYWRTMYINK
jgi:hypothetical protein